MFELSMILGLVGFVAGLGLCVAKYFGANFSWALPLWFLGLSAIPAGFGLYCVWKLLTWGNH